MPILSALTVRSEAQTPSSTANLWLLLGCFLLPTQALLLCSKPNKYKIKKYNKEYSDSLQDDSNFNIIKTFVISLDECRKFCENLAHRQFKGAYWNQITVKIAVK